MMDIVNITPFSIKVASVIGSFILVPKQAHSISDFLIKVRNTPNVVKDKITNVINKTRGNCNSAR